MGRSPTLRIAALLAVVVAAGALACGGAKPPALNAAEVADCWIGEYHPAGSLSAVMAAYTESSPADFNTETTPEFEATIELRDGTTVCLAFSSLFPRHHVLVFVSRDKQEPGQAYEIRAPGLLDAVLALAGDHLDKATVNPLAH